jgi:hypothetical protein
MGAQDYNKKRDRMSNRRSNEFVTADSSADRVELGEPLGSEQDRRMRLARVIEGEIIPRLLISLSVGVRAARPTPSELHAGADPQPTADSFQATPTPAGTAARRY